MTEQIKGAPSLARPSLFKLPKEWPPRSTVRADGPPMPSAGPWRVGPHWAGETVFVVASGPSLAALDPDMVRGRKVIAINSSYEIVPFADIVYFGDGRWWEVHKKRLLGMQPRPRLATVSGIAKHPDLLKLGRMKPESQATGFSDRRDLVASQRTSLQGAINLAAHLCSATEGPVGNIVLIGADMGRAPDGRTHGHTPHKWANRAGNVTWDEQMRHLKWIVPHLRRRGISVVNCSPASRIPWWPKMTLQAFLTLEKTAAKGGWKWSEKLDG